MYKKLTTVVEKRQQASEHGETNTSISASILSQSKVYTYTQTVHTHKYTYIIIGMKDNTPHPGAGQKCSTLSVHRFRNKQPRLRCML